MMTYYADLTSYEYFENQNDNQTKNVGWLDQQHDFETGVPPVDVLAMLWMYCKYSVNQTRGIHRCPFCSDGNNVQYGDERLVLGASEIRVFGKDLVYAAPTMIFHYVAQHNYAPPTQFIEALLNSAPPPTVSYMNRIEQLGLSSQKTDAPD